MSDQKPGGPKKDPLLVNKIMAAALTAALLVAGLPQLAAAVFGGGHHGGGAEELHLSYCCVELKTAGPAEDEKAFDLGAMMAASSVSAGERRASLCKSCHTFDRGGANGAGPNLWNIVGRDVGSVSGFGYTNALTEFGGTWTYERLDGYLKNSQDYLPGTAMVQRFARDDQRAELLVYLGSLSDDPVPYPAPLLERAEEAAAEEGAH